MPTFTINSSDSSTVIYSGYLTKSPPLVSSRTTLKRWRRRFFVLHPNKSVEYYGSPSLNTLKGAVDLRECIHIEVGLYYKKRSNVICLTTLRRKFFFQAQSSLEMWYWAGLVRAVKTTQEGESMSLPSLSGQVGSGGVDQGADTFQETFPIEKTVATVSPMHHHDNPSSSKILNIKAVLTRNKSDAHRTQIVGVQHRVMATPSGPAPQRASLAYTFEAEQRSAEVEETFKKKFQESKKRKEVKGRSRLPSSEDEFDFYTGDNNLERKLNQPIGNLDTIESEEGDKSGDCESGSGLDHSPSRQPVLDHSPLLPSTHRSKRLSKRRATDLTSGKETHFSDHSISDDNDDFGLEGSLANQFLFKEKARSMDSIRQGDSGFESSSPSFKVHILPPTLPHPPQQTTPPSPSPSWLKDVRFVCELPNSVDFTHYAAYPFSYSGGTLQPGNSEVTLHVPPGAISPYDSLFFPELSASAMWRPLVVVDAKSCDPSLKEMPFFLPVTPLMKLTPSRELAGNQQSIRFNHPITLKCPHSVLTHTAQNNKYTFVAMIASFTRSQQKQHGRRKEKVSLSFSVYPVATGNPSNITDIRELLRSQSFVVGLQDQSMTIYSRQLSEPLWIIGGIVSTDIMGASEPEGGVVRGLSPVKIYRLKVFTKFSAHSRQHCVVAYLVEDYYDAKRTIEALCYKQEFNSCIKQGEESRLELPMDSNAVVTAAIGKAKGQGYRLGTLEQDMVECDGCWKASVFYIQISSSRQQTSPVGVVGLSLKILLDRQICCDQKISLILK